ncbi:hypothetical protein TWF225_005490 [Orbilia oligospora]|nr:hypothetical protein TWF225_005490 [Orbilia oligospora]KAF3292297.1 hypothetical protein TWF132_005687 [Orbilia oligospora]
MPHDSSFGWDAWDQQKPKRAATMENGSLPEINRYNIYLKNMSAHTPNLQYRVFRSRGGIGYRNHGCYDSHVEAELEEERQAPPTIYQINEIKIEIESEKWFILTKRRKTQELRN